jgi:hypothetical protein
VFRLATAWRRSNKCAGLMKALSAWRRSESLFSMVNSLPRDLPNWPRGLARTRHTHAGPHDLPPTVWFTLFYAARPHMPAGAGVFLPLCPTEFVIHLRSKFALTPYRCAVPATDTPVFMHQPTPASLVGRSGAVCLCRDPSPVCSTSLSSSLT